MKMIPLFNQAGALRSYFPDSTITRRGEEEITWVHSVTPSPLSDTYQLKLHYSHKDGAAVYVLAPRLKLAPGAVTLPHVYSLEKQKLCLWYPKDREWNTGMYYVHTLIPWACEWLLHYETWAAGNGWHGGGIEHGDLEEKA
jgi:hypothetical protein